MPKTGLCKIGYIYNLKEYPQIIKDLSGISYVDFDSFNSYIDNLWDNSRVLCFDEDLNSVSNESNNIKFFMIDTGFKKINTSEDLFALFYSDCASELKSSDNWQGVEIGTKDDLLAIQKMHLFDSYTEIPDYKVITNVLQKITASDIHINDCKKTLRQSFIAAKENANLAIIINEYDNDKRMAFFPLLNYASVSGEQLFIKMEKNKFSKGKDWYGAYILDREELLDELLDFYFFHIGNFIFKSLQDANLFFDDLASKAMPETWKSPNNSENAIYSQPILTSYLKFTYFRLLEEDEHISDETKRKIQTYDGKCYFNSGLLDRNFRQIVIVGEKEHHQVVLPGLGKHTFELLKNLHAYSHNDHKIASIFNEDELPALASYFKDYSQVVFDANLDIQTNDEHIFEDGVSNGRLPKYQEEYEKVKNNAYEKGLLLARIARDFDSARDRAKLMAERNYKLAVPQFWKETGDIQFLLPIYLGEREEAEKPQCALVLSKVTGVRRPYYRGATILTLEMAYNNARLIAKPDVFWLNDLA